VNSGIAALALGAAALAFAVAAIYAQTDGLRAVTSDALPAVAVRSHPALQTRLRAADGAPLAGLPGAGSLRLVEISYARCRTTCAAQGVALAQIARAFAPQIESGFLTLVSLSVDPEDCPRFLEQRLRAFGAQSPGWTGACVLDRSDLESLHRSSGVVAIQDRSGEIRHTPGMFLVSPSGRILRYLPVGDKQSVALALLSTGLAGARND
jgi:cytochrome oxidase Cu insertion factor (SCO1/SenC/PrrC family)